MYESLTEAGHRQSLEPGIPETAGHEELGPRCTKEDSSRALRATSRQRHKRQGESCPASRCSAESVRWRSIGRLVFSPCGPKESKECVGASQQHLGWNEWLRDSEPAHL